MIIKFINEWDVNDMNGGGKRIMDRNLKFEIIVNLYVEFINFLEKHYKTLDDIKYIIIKENDDNYIILKEDFIRLSKTINYNMGYGYGKKLNDELLFLGDNFRIEILQMEYFNYIEDNNSHINIPTKIKRNLQLYIEDDWEGNSSMSF